MIYIYFQCKMSLCKKGNIDITCNEILPGANCLVPGKSKIYISTEYSFSLFSPYPFLQEMRKISWWFLYLCKVESAPYSIEKGDIFGSVFINSIKRAICMWELINFHQSCASRQIKLMQTQMNCIIVIRLLQTGFLKILSVFFPWILSLGLTSIAYH